MTDGSFKILMTKLIKIYQIKCDIDNLTDDALILELLEADDRFKMFKAKESIDEIFKTTGGNPFFYVCKNTV